MIYLKNNEIYFFYMSKETRDDKNVKKKKNIGTSILNVID